MLEYELYFGKGQPETNIEITYTQTTTGTTTADVISVAFNGAKSRHNMHSAVRFFYANGGGPCYIVSVEVINPPWAMGFRSQIFLTWHRQRARSHCQRRRTDADNFPGRSEYG
jgi:hypothetical protein